jgi:alkylhydroperoxidase family enzyme
MVAFTDSQLRTVWAAADRVPFEKRGVFVEWVVARLQLQRGFTDADLDDAVRAALTGLIQSVAWSGRRFPPPWTVEELESAL